MSETDHVAHVSHEADPNVPTDTLHKGHPNALLVLASLGVLTALEVGVTYIPGIPHAPFLLAMSFLKALIVLLFFMHLKYDSRWFSFIFFIPFVLVIPFILVTLLG